MDRLTCELKVLATLSGAAIVEQRKWLRDRVETVAETRAALVIFKYYDASPRMFRFGRLQSQLLPVARYPVFDKVKKVWRSQNLDDYVASTGSTKTVLTRPGRFVHHCEYDVCSLGRW